MGAAVGCAMSDRAAILLKKIRRGKETILQEFVVQRQEETQWLDFKANPTKEDKTGNHERITTFDGRLTDRGKRLLSKALSGYANTDSGLIVWGVDCRREDGIDGARELVPFDNLKSVASAFRLISDQLVDPVVTGVKHVDVPVASGENRGYVVTYVPYDDRQLHMATAAKQCTYYKRAGNKFEAMLSFEVERGYARKPAPKLELVSVVRATHETTHEFTAFVYIGIRNVGQGLATYPALVLDRRDPALMLLRQGGFLIDSDGVDGNRQHGLPLRPLTVPLDTDTARYFFEGGRDRAIYPGTCLWVTRTAPRKLRIFEEPPNQGLDIHYQLHCDGFSAEGTERVSHDEFLKLRGEILKRRQSGT